MSTRVSVIIPSYNRAQYISQAIESILVQTFQDFEIIIIDDASTDNTQEVLRAYLAYPRVKIVTNETNLGIAKTRNKGVSLAQGEYIAMLDSDDYWTDTEKLTKQAHVLDTEPKIGVVGTGITLVHANDKKIKDVSFARTDAEIRERILVKNQFAQSSVLFRKNLFEKIGGYDTSLIVAEDYDLWLKIGIYANFANLPESTVSYRVHAASASAQKLRMARTTYMLVKKYSAHYPHSMQAKILGIVRILKGYINL